MAEVYISIQHNISVKSTSIGEHNIYIGYQDSKKLHLSMAGKIRKLGNFFSGFLLSGYLDSGLEKKQMGPLVVASDKIDFIVQKEICLGHIAEVTL